MYNFAPLREERQNNETQHIFTFFHLNIFGIIRHGADDAKREGD